MSAAQGLGLHHIPVVGDRDLLVSVVAECGAVTVYDKAEDLVRSSDLIVFAAVAGEPHVTDPAWFAHHPLVLHISLRDLSTDVILASCNVTDDVEHCMKANTSLHLAKSASAIGNS